jgi:preprotein translocase subunit SecF
MEFFRIKKDIPFMRHALVFNVISALTFVAAVFFLLHRGLHFSVEFTGGTVMELKYAQPAKLEQIRHSLEQIGYEQPEVTGFGTAHDVMLRLPVIKSVSSKDASQLVFNKLCAAEQGTAKQIDNVSAKGEHVVRSACMDAAGVEAVSLQKVEFVGPQVGDELAQNGLNALVMVIVGVMIYLAVRFEWKFAVAAIVANLHDVVIILGFFAFFQWEFSLTVLAAVLAVLGYSVNESVVIFDRIRENFRKQRKSSVHEVIDNAYHHHPRLYADDGAVDAVPWRPDAALLRDRADHWYLLRYLLVGVRGGRRGHVAGREARRPDQADQGKRRDGWRGGVSASCFF